MPPDTPQPGSAQDWLRYAVSDLELARTSGTPSVMLESLCYHAQQCAEKAVKAVLVACHVPVPRTHSIGLLLDSLPEQVVLPEDIEEAAVLTDYAVMCRYPGDAEPVTRSEYERAMHLAEAVLGWARQIVEQRQAEESAGGTTDDAS
jgi:HEPN domain-containing protein